MVRALTKCWAVIDLMAFIWASCCALVKSEIYQREPLHQQERQYALLDRAGSGRRDDVTKRNQKRIISVYLAIGDETIGAFDGVP